MTSAVAAPTALAAVFKGVAFEHRSMNTLRTHLSMALRRVGGKGDGGIDLQGWWWLPTECVSLHLSSGTCTQDARTPVRVYAQCKAEGKKIGPRYIREFEGAVLRYSAHLAAAKDEEPATRDPLVGVFVSTSPLTKASLLQAFSSPIPLALLHLPENDPSDLATSSTNPDTPGDPPGSLVFNPALNGASGLLRGTIEARWELSLSSHCRDWRPGMWRDGRRVESWIPSVDFAE